MRDLLQVGQGLQIGRVVGVPNGAGATPIVRPGPAAAGACAGVTHVPASAPTISAVTVGPDLGPADQRAVHRRHHDARRSTARSSDVNGRRDCRRRASRSPSTPASNISDDPDVNGDNVRVGDLLEIRRGAVAVIAAVTDVAGQTVTFAPGDPLGLNQFDAALNNSMTQVLAAPHGAAAPRPTGSG